VSAPIFVDNRESVTKLIDSQSQIVSLIVSDKDKKLRVESESIVLNFDDMMQKGSKMMMGYLKESKSISHE